MKKGEENSSPTLLLLNEKLTFLVTGGLHVALDVALQVAAELGRGGEEGQAHGHQLPAGRQAARAHVARGLTHQLHVQLVPQALRWRIEESLMLENRMEYKNRIQ